jgi:hypothetical protein
MNDELSKASELLWNNRGKDEDMDFVYGRVYTQIDPRLLYIIEVVP